MSNHKRHHHCWLKSVSPSSVYRRSTRTVHDRPGLVHGPIGVFNYQCHILRVISVRGFALDALSLS